MFTDRAPSAGFRDEDPNIIVSIEQAEALARDAGIKEPGHLRAIEAKVAYEQLGVPEGQFFPLETEEILTLGARPISESDVMKVGALREVEGEMRVASNRQLGSISHWVFGARHAKAQESKMSEEEAARQLGMMEYGEVGRYKIVGKNLIARLADRKLVLAPDTPGVRSSLEMANFKQYGAPEFEDEYGPVASEDEWGGFSLRGYMPDGDEVPIQRRPNTSYEAYEVNKEWRSVAASWRERDGVRPGLSTPVARTAVTATLNGNNPPTTVYSLEDLAEIEAIKAASTVAKTQVIPVVEAKMGSLVSPEAWTGYMNHDEVLYTANRVVEGVSADISRELVGRFELPRETDVLATFKQMPDDELAVVEAALAYKVGRGDPGDPEIKQATQVLALILKVRIEKARKSGAV